MRLIRAVIKNFKCIEKEQVEFPDTKGLVLITGRNDQNPLMGANGIGKTTFFDAITWALYGKTARGLKASKLLRSGTDGGYSVSLYFDSFEVHRTWNPNSLKLNRSEAHQEEIDRKIGLTYDQFLLTTYAQQAGQQFLDLTAGEKLSFLSTIFDLERWTRAADASKEKLKASQTIFHDQQREQQYLELEIDTARKNLEAIEKWISDWDEKEKQRKDKLQVDLISLQAQSQDWEREQESQYKEQDQKRQQWEIERQAEFDEWETEKKSLLLLLKPIDMQEAQGTLNWIQESIDEVDSDFRAANFELSQLDKDLKVIEHKIETLNVQIEQLNSNKDNCPTCDQPLPHQKHSDLIGTAEKQRDRLMNDQTEKYMARQHKNEVIVSCQELRKGLCQQQQGFQIKFAELQAQQDLQTQYRQRVDQIYVKQSMKRKNPFAEEKVSINPFKTAIKQIQDSLLVHEDNPYIAQKDQVQQYISKLTEELNQKRKKTNELEAVCLNYEFWVKKFPQVKLAILDEMIMELELHFNKALSSLGLSDWSISLSTERELKSEMIRKELSLRVMQGSREVDLDVLSGGERQRFRLASALSISEMIKSRLGVALRLWMLDEPSIALSREGTEQMLEYLEQLSRDLLILIADHKIESYGRFDQVWQIVKNEFGVSSIKSSNIMAELIGN